jgi:Mrp family chromosome partitioning ATPase
VRDRKTTTAVNLAIALAQTDQRVLLMDTDLRKPSLHRVFGVERSPGLTEVLLADQEWRVALRTVADIMLGFLGLDRLLVRPQIDNLSLLPSGAAVPNPSVFLASHRMAEPIATLRKDFDCVLFDSPPIFPVTTRPSWPPGSTAPCSSPGPVGSPAWPSGDRRTSSRTSGARSWASSSPASART